jgi:hypothetical protein
MVQMRAIFTLSLEEATERYRRVLSKLPVARGMAPIDFSGIELRSDEQIRNALRGIGMRHHFEINHWFSLVSWSRVTGDPNTIRIVVEADGPQFETICQAISETLTLV